MGSVPAVWKALLLMSFFLVARNDGPSVLLLLVQIPSAERDRVYPFHILAKPLPKLQ